jgi:hypothetical protein
MRIVEDFDGVIEWEELRPEWMIFMGNMVGASERDRTSDLLITNQPA